MSAGATHVQDRLLELTYGELSADDARAVETHVEECPACRQALDEIRGVRRVMAKLSQPAAPREKLDSLLAYAEQAARRAGAGSAPKARWWSRWLVPAGGIAAAVTFGIVAHEVSKSPGLENPAEQVLREKLGGKPGAPAATVETPAEVFRREEWTHEVKPPEPDPRLEARGSVDPERLREELDRAFNGPNPVSKDESARQVKKATRPAGPERSQKRDAPAEGKKGFGLGYGTGASAGGVAENRAADVSLGGIQGGRSGAERSSPNAPSVRSAPESSGLGSAGVGAIGHGAGAGAVAGERAADIAAPEGKTARPTRVAAPSPSGAASSPPAAAVAKPASEPPEPAMRSASEDRAPTSAPVRSGSKKSAPAREAAPSEAQSAPAAATPAAPRSATKSARVEIANEAMQSDGEHSSSADPARSQAQELSQKALAAHRVGATAQEVDYLRQALATGIRDPAVITHLLLRLCDAQLALGNVADGEAACERVVREFPSSSAANVASRRLAESRAGRTKPEPAVPATAVPAETP